MGFARNCNFSAVKSVSANEIQKFSKFSLVRVPGKNESIHWNEKQSQKGSCRNPENNGTWSGKIMICVALQSRSKGTN